MSDLFSVYFLTLQFMPIGHETDGACNQRGASDLPDGRMCLPAIACKFA